MSTADRILAAWRLWRVTRLLEASRLAREAGHHRRACVLLERAGAVLRTNRAMLG